MAYEKFLLISDDISVCIHTNNTLDKNVRNQMKEYGIKTSITSPIYVNDEIEMYFAIFDTQNELTLDNSELNFINIITKVIQSIAQ